ncbi:uncharacterized protein N7469_010803, partial [Penicillium citrinum]
EYNYIDKFDFLDNYQCAQLKIFQQSVIIQNSFAASGLVPIDAEGPPKSIKNYTRSDHQRSLHSTPQKMRINARNAIGQLDRYSANRFASRSTYGRFPCAGGIAYSGKSTGEEGSA